MRLALARPVQNGGVPVALPSWVIASSPARLCVDHFQRHSHSEARHEPNSASVRERNRNASTSNEGMRLACLPFDAENHVILIG